MKISALLLLCIVFASCGDIVSCGFLDNDEVCVTVLNQSGNKVNSLRVFHEDGQEKVLDIENESQASITFKIAGESSFSLSANLDNDELLESRDVYIEGGFRRTAIVLRDTITIVKSY